MVLWHPFPLGGQGKLWHSPAAFFRCNSEPSIPWVCVPTILIRFIIHRLTTQPACSLFRPMAFLSWLDSMRKSSKFSITLPWMSISVVLSDSSLQSIYSLSDFCNLASWLGCMWWLLLSTSGTCSFLVSKNSYSRGRKGVTAVSPRLVCIVQLSIWITNPCCNPRIEDIHQTLCTRKIHWLSIA